MRSRVLTIAALLGVSACAPGGGGASSPAASNPDQHKVVGLNGIEGEINGKIIPGSKFSRLQIGMVSREAESIAGLPNDTAGHITGKQFIPFYFGGDGTRVEAFYRGEGQLTYTHPSIGSTTLVLIGITADPTERGFAH